MGLGPEVVDLVRLHIAQQVHQRDPVRQIDVVQQQPPVRGVRVLVDVVDALGVEARRASHQPVHFIALTQQQFGEI